MLSAMRAAAQSAGVAMARALKLGGSDSPEAQAAYESDSDYDSDYESDGEEIVEAVTEFLGEFSTVCPTLACADSVSAATHLQLFLALQICKRLHNVRIPNALSAKRWAMESVAGASS